MPRVKIGPALPDREKLDVEIGACVISTLVNFAAVGIPHSAGQRPFTLLVISCFAAWRTGCRPTVLGTWTGRVSACSIGRGQKQRLIDIPGAKVLAHSPSLNQTRWDLNSDYSDRLLDQRIDDLRAVMDAADMDQAALLGISEGGPLTALFAATYPDRCRGRSD